MNNEPRSESPLVYYCPKCGDILPSRESGDSPECMESRCPCLNEITSPTFSERCKAEGTRDVVFLFQYATSEFIGHPYTEDGEYGHDGEGIILGDTVKGHWTPRQDAEYLTTEEMMEMETVDGHPCVIKNWKTEFVTLTREEGEKHGKERSYNYPDGWQVYGIPSNGRLADLIKTT